MKNRADVLCEHGLPPEPCCDALFNLGRVKRRVGGFEDCTGVAFNLK
jgi:hypothetical protein